MRAKFHHRWLATGIRVLTILAAIVGYDVVTSSNASAASCYYATGAAAHALCWLDFTTYSGAGTQNFSYTLADGSTFTGTITNSGTAAAAVDALPLGAAYGLGNTGYTGVLGKPVFVSGTKTKVGPITFSNAQITDTQGRVASNVALIGSDAESTDFADANAGATTAMTWNGSTNISLLQTLAPASGGTSNCTPTNFNTTAAYCIPTGSSNSSDLIASDTITPAQTFAMTATPVNTYGRQAFAFALNTALLTVSKNVAGRINTSDQFEVELVNGTGTAFATGTTTGTGTTASATAGAVPGTAYTLKEIATSGTLGNYASTVACVNAVTSSTTLPAANSAATSISITPAVDDQITCKFTNTPLSATVTPVNATNTAAGAASLTDTFTLKNTSSIAGTFVVAQPTITSSTGSTETITGYTFGGFAYSSLAAVNAAIAAAGTTASGGTILVGVTYVTNQSSSSSTDTVSLPAAVTSGTGSSPTASGTETDSIMALPTATTATNCYVATGANQHLICWLDFTGFAGGTESFSLKMPDGSILTGTAAESGAGYAYAIDAAPVIAGVGLGGGDYTGIGGKPVFYQTTQQTQAPVTLSNLKLTDPNGFSVTTVAMAGADAERTGVPAQPEYMYWSTNGASWTNLQLLTATNPTTTNICTLSALGANVNCMGATGDPVNAYLLRTFVNTTASGSPQSFSMASTSITGSQGFAFGIDLSLLTASKTIASRASSSDQFTMTVTRAANSGAPTPVGTPVASSTSTGTGTSVSATTPFYVIPNENYIFSESMAAGSPSLLSQYATTYTCTNAQVASGSVGETQVLPAANSSGQSVVIIPQPDAEITCAFNNTALVLTNTPTNATASDQAGATATDLFTLTNTSLIAGTFVVQTPTITSSLGGTVTPSSYTFSGTTYTTIAALNSAIAAAGTTASGGTITVGVVYRTNSSSSSSTDTVVVPATVSAGTGTSAAANGTETDTIAPLPASTTGTMCYVATGANQHLICWFDFSGYAGVGSETFSFKMPDGSTLTGTIDNTGTLNEPPNASPLYNGPTFGNSAYTGVLGKPIFTVPTTTTASPMVISNLTLTDPNGHAVSTIGFVGADGEDTDGATGNEKLNWQTTGAAWTLLQLMPGSSATTNVCTLSALGANVTCTSATAGPPVEAYLLRSILNTTTSGAAQNAGMSATTTAQEGFVFGIDLSLLTTTKTVASRVAPSDQFTVQVGRGTNVAAPASPAPVGTPFASGSTTSTGTTATATTPYYVIPNENYIFSEAMATGSASALSQYSTTVTCTNAMPTTGVTQVLPAAATAAQSVVIVPQPDAEITCAFTNYGMVLTDTANTPTVVVSAGSTRTDSFTLKNTSSIAGTFAVVAPSIVTGGGTVLTPSATTAAYILNNAATGTCSVATPCTLATLNSTIAAAAQTAINGTIVVGVQYTVPTASGTVVTATVPATIANGTGTSAQASAAETDTVPGLAISKTGTTAASPGGLVAYTLTITNPSGLAENGAVVTDPLPTGVTFKNASCAVAGGAVCAAPTTAIAGGVTTLSDTITTLPVGGTATITISTAAGAPGTVTNQATVTPPTGTNGGAQTSAVVTTTIAQTNGITKTVTNLTHTAFNSGQYTNTANAGLPGDTLQYTLSFTNNTGAAIGNLAFTDVLPAQVTYVSTSCSGSTTPLTCAATPAGAPTTYTFAGSLAAGASVSITINVTIK